MIHDLIHVAHRLVAAVTHIGGDIGDIGIDMAAAIAHDALKQIDAED